MAEIERNIPESLRGMIERKLESLDDEQRQLLRVAAIQGVQFDSAIVAQVLGRDPADVEDALQSLDDVHGLVELLREQEFPSRLFSLRYQFVHVLYQSALYTSVSPTRRSAWSGKVAEALEKEYGDRRRNVAAELALLYEMARDPWRASEHFLAAAELASTRFSTREALAFAKKGLACMTLVRDRPDIDVRELALQKALLHPLAVIEGYGTPACERVSQRIVELAERLEDHGSLFAALDGALFVHMCRGECVEAAAIADRMLNVAARSASEVQLLNAHMWATIAQHHRGHLRIAQDHADACVRIGTPTNQTARLITIWDPVVATLAESSRILWLLGRTRESRAAADRASGSRARSGIRIPCRSPSCSTAGCTDTGKTGRPVSRRQQKRSASVRNTVWHKQWHGMGACTAGRWLTPAGVPTGWQSSRARLATRCGSWVKSRCPTFARCSPRC
jgi:hypothetical protein